MKKRKKLKETRKCFPNPERKEKPQNLEGKLVTSRYKKDRDKGHGGHLRAAIGNDHNIRC